VASNPKLLAALGVWHNQWTKTFLNDIIVFALSIPLVVLYYYTVKHTEKK
jgi:hypothetical protein